MTHFWQRSYRTLTALALFAMMMAFVGPLISQTQRLMDMPAHGETSRSPSHMASRHVGHVSMPGPNSGSHWHMAACGYCDLFLHAPGIEPPRVVPPIAPPPPWKQPQRTVALPVAAIVYPRYSPRAPPRV